MKDKIFEIIISGFLSLTLILGICNLAYADTFNIGVSSSWDGIVEGSPGQTLDLSLQLANQSLTSNNDASNFTSKIHLIPTDVDPTKYANLPENQKLQVEASKWVQFDKNDVVLNVGDKASVGVKVAIPSNSAYGEYSTLITVNTSPYNTKSSTVNVNINTKITVRLVIEVVNAATKTNGLVESSKIVGMKITDDLTPTSIGDILEGILIPNDNWVQNFKDLFTKVYKFTSEKNGITYSTIDIPDIKKVPLSAVKTDDTKKLNNSNYIYIPKELTGTTKIDGLSINGNQIDVTSGSNKFSIVTPNPETATDIFSQVNALLPDINKLELNADNNNSIQFQYLLDNVEVYSVKQEKPPILYVKYSIQNTGTKTIIPKGVLAIMSGGKIIQESQYSSTIIEPGKTKDIIAEINYASLGTGQGTYILRSVIKPSSSSQDITMNLDLNFTHLRNLIIISVIAIILLTILTLLFLVFMKKKKTKNYLTFKEKG